MGEELILVRKLAYDGRESWRWVGKLVERDGQTTVVDAVFNGPERDLGYMALEATDLYHEFYYGDRWFNVFQIFRRDGVLKGWYCNVCKPANLSTEEISFVDMVLDLFVYPDGRTLLLDEEDFAEKERAVYSRDDARRAREGLAELQEMVRDCRRPFDLLQAKGTGSRGLETA